MSGGSGTATDPPTIPRTPLCKPSSLKHSLLLPHTSPAATSRSTGVAFDQSFPLSCNAVLADGLPQALVTVCRVSSYRMAALGTPSPAA